MIVRARLIARSTADGLASVKDAIPLGKEYLVDLSTRRTAYLFNVDVGCPHSKELVNEWPSGRFLYLELLEVLGAP